MDDNLIFRAVSIPYRTADGTIKEYAGFTRSQYIALQSEWERMAAAVERLMEENAKYKQMLIDGRRWNEGPQTIAA